MLRVPDRVLCNYKWLEKLKATMVDIHVDFEFDHCSFNITVMPNVEQESKPFKYQHFWSQHPQFNSIVNECRGRDVAWHVMSVLHSRMKDVRKDLKILHQEEFSHISAELETN
ncbi:hypothetical protein LIER_18639 [Lithospermum erythrorhizon]|uniref:Uncharacterized protein n=1 Tax=Lithospermum erythrorhizon TaxID=34254 RepID=A0AAV3QER5_LITER